MRDKRIEYRGVLVTEDCDNVEKHIQQECKKFIKTLLNDDTCKDFIIPDLEYIILGNIYCAIVELAIDEHMKMLLEGSNSQSNCQY